MGSEEKGGREGKKGIAFKWLTDTGVRRYINLSCSFSICLRAKTSLVRRGHVVSGNVAHKANILTTLTNKSYTLPMLVMS